MELTEIDDPELGPEGYRLRVTESGVAAAGTLAGLRWALQTLRQLRSADGSALCVEIVDIPRYPWRGSLLDVARWCHPIEFVYRYVDLLALHKLNTLHLHLTDDQGWRFEVRKYPLLTSVGGFRTESNAGHAREQRFDGRPHGGWYTQAELRDLVRYAAERGVRVMPELDVPGHMQAAISAYPELGNDRGRQLAVRTAWGISSHVLNAEELTVRFVKDVLDELVDVFGFEVIHLGGDEVPPDEWRASPAARARAIAYGLSTVDELGGWWARELAAHLATYGRRAGYWDEVLEHSPPAGALVFAWRDESRVAAARAQGYATVATPQEYTYFDWAESEGPEEPLAINGPLALDRVYGYEPGEVLGVQGQLWSEYLPTGDLVLWRAYPRLAALAEVGWTAHRQGYPQFLERLATHRRRLEAMGVPATAPR